MLNEMMGSGIIRGIIGASFGIFVIGGMLLYYAAKNENDPEEAIEAGKIMLCSATLGFLATIALVLVQ